MARRYLLGFDVGSSSVKASLTDVDSGEITASAFYPDHEAPIMAVKQGGQSKTHRCGGTMPSCRFRELWQRLVPREKTSLL